MSRMGECGKVSEEINRYMPKKLKAAKKLSGESFLPQQELLDQLRKNFPEIFSEGKIDVKKLKKTFGEQVDESEERYGLTWAGKTDCFREIQEPTTCTLVPDKKESVDFDKTENIFIEGDNLEVLKVLQRSYYGKIKMIYIDPPYNTGNDFVYNDNFKESKADYRERSGQNDNCRQTALQKNTKDSGHFHSNWLNMMYPRLFLARNLLRQDGVIFISIDDNEVHNLRMIMNEIFGEENSLTESPTALIWQRSGTTAGHFSNAHEYILCYAKSKVDTPFFHLKDYGSEKIISHGALKKISRANPESEITFPAGMDFEGEDATFEGVIGGSEKQTINGKMIFKGGKLQKPVSISAGWGMKEQVLSWISGEDTFDTKGQRVLRFYFNKEGILWYEKERGTVHPKTILPSNLGSTKTGTQELVTLFGSKFFDYPKPSALLRYLASFSSHEDDIMLDFFAGTGTTAHAVMALNAEDGGNRKCISVQLDEPTDENSEAYKAGYKNIAQLARERIRRAAKEIKKEHKDKKLDLGFKAFKIHKSNFKIWENNIQNEKELLEQMKMSIDNLKKGAKMENVLYELILKLGLDLNIQTEKKTVAKKEYFLLNEGEVAICLEEKINQQLIDAIVKDKPVRFVCLEHAFAKNDELKTNALLQMEQMGIDFRVV